MRSRLLALVMGTALLAWWSCGGGTDLSGSNQTDTLTVGNYYFAPFLDSVKAAANDSVTLTFIWEIGGVTHNVTWDTGPGNKVPTNSPNQSSGAYMVTLGVGTYTYHCMFHPADMTGTIVVQPPGP
jgi:plastocyanin